MVVNPKCRGMGTHPLATDKVWFSNTRKSNIYDQLSSGKHGNTDDILKWYLHFLY